jgi:Spy/CpxP family protein refolding chaperone
MYMKKHLVMNRFIVLFTMLLITVAAHAQDFKNNTKLQERITQAKLAEIQRALTLSDATMAEFAPVYKKYETELNKVISSSQGKQMRVHPDSLTTDEADRLIKAKLDDAVSISTIRKNYYSDFRSVLTPQQIMKLYQSEAQLRKKVMMEFRRRFGDRMR